VRLARVGITGFVPFSDPQKTGGVFYATLSSNEETIGSSSTLARRTRSPWPCGGAPVDVDEAIFAKSSVRPAT
jgi:hypothetical protein